MMSFMDDPFLSRLDRQVVSHRVDCRHSSVQVELCQRVVDEHGTEDRGPVAGGHVGGHH